MREFKLTGRRQLAFSVDAPRPQPGPGEVLVAVAACTICGRSDLAYYHYHGLRDHCATGCFGHEIAGEVAALGAGVQSVAIGERVFIRTPITTGYAEYARAREIAVGRLPRTIGFEHGAILQLLPLAVHATRGVTLGDKVLIVGQGPVGLMALQVAKLRGAAAITVIDLDPWRLETARELGADVVLTAAEAEAAGIAQAGFDVAIEAVGTPSTANLCVNAARQAGLVVFLGTHHIDTHVTFDMVMWEKKGLRVHSSAEPNDEARVWAMKAAQRLVDAGRIRLDPMLSHQYGLAALEDAITHLSDSSVLEPEGEATIRPGPPDRTLKIAICP